MPSELVGAALDGKSVLALAPKKEGWEEGKASCLSVFPTSAEQGQEGFDLRERGRRRVGLRAWTRETMWKRSDGKTSLSGYLLKTSMASYHLSDPAENHALENLGN